MRQFHLAGANFPLDIPKTGKTYIRVGYYSPFSSLCAWEYDCNDCAHLIEKLQSFVIAEIVAIHVSHDNSDFIHHTSQNIDN